MTDVHTRSRTRPVSLGGRVAREIEGDASGVPRAGSTQVPKYPSPGTALNIFVFLATSCILVRSSASSSMNHGLVYGASLPQHQLRPWHERGQRVVEDLYGSGICAPWSPSSSVFRNSTNRTLRRTSTFNAVSSGISRCVMIRKWSTFGPWCTSSTARCVPVTPQSRRRCRAKVLRPRCPQGGYR